MSNTEQEMQTEPSQGQIKKSAFIFCFIVFYMLFMLDFAARLGITSAFPAMKQDLGLSDSSIGMAGSGVLLGMTLFVMPCSYLADKFSKKRAINIMSLIWGAGCALCGMASHLGFVIAGRFMVGIGNASFAPVSVAMLTSWVPRKLWGTTIGIYNSAMSLGLALGTTVVGVLVHNFGWRSAFFFIGGLSILFGILSFFVQEAKTDNSFPNKIERSVSSKTGNAVTVREAFAYTMKNKTLLLLGSGVGLANMGYTAMITWIPMYLVRIMGWNAAEVAAYMGPVYLIQGLVVTALSGVFIDWLNRKTSPRSRAFLGFPAFLLCGFSYFCGFHYQWIIPLAFGMFLFKIPVTGVHVATQELVPPRYKSTAYGTYVILLQGIGFFGSLLVGMLSDNFGLQKAVEYMQFVFVAGAILMFLGGLTYMQDLQRTVDMENTKV